MSRIGRGVIAASAMTVFLIGASWRLEAQEGGAAGKAAAQPKASGAARRVPPYFGQLGLTTEQREAVYKARARHQERIEALKKEIERATAQEMSDCEAVLTEAQRQLLEQLRAKRKGQVKAANEPAKGGKDAAAREE